MIARVATAGNSLVLNLVRVGKQEDGMPDRARDSRFVKWIFFSRGIFATSSRRTRQPLSPSTGLMGVHADQRQEHGVE